MKKVIHILSGGLDSTTLLYWLLKKGYQVECISFNYGQRHKKELIKAEQTCKKLNVPHTLVDLRNITKLISNSALTSNMPVPEGHYEQKNMKDTVVPSRNTIMATIAQGYAVNKVFNAVSLGVHSGDHAIYPDCRPEFVQALKALFKINNYKPIDVLTPFSSISKVGIVKEGLKLGVDFSLTWTCYKGLKNPCGKCGSCVERAEAFKINKAKDTLIK